MCKSCGCKCSAGKPVKGCKCTCKTCSGGTPAKKAPAKKVGKK